MREAAALDDHPRGDGLQEADDGEQRPGGRDVAALDAVGEGGAGDGGAEGAAEAAEGGGEAIKSAEYAQRGRGVGQEDGDAGEADDDGEALDKQDHTQCNIAVALPLDERAVRCGHVDERV